MDGCEVYQIKPLGRFETSFSKIIKRHYRKNKRGREAFEELIDSYIEQLRENPISEVISDDEGFPKGSYRENLEFRKIRFSLPDMRGQARYGRLMYVVYEPQCTVYLMWIYTHAEFGTKNKTRPPDQDLKQEFSIIIKDLEETEE